MTSTRRHRDLLGPPPPPDRARCCSSSPWRGPALPCHLPVIALTLWNTPTGRTPPIRRMIRPIAWSRTTTGCYRMVSPARWRTISRGLGPIAASKAWTRARRTRASAKRPCRMVSRLCTWRGVLICRILGKTTSVQGRFLRLRVSHVKFRLFRVRMISE